MAIDLAQCTGCQACVTACYAENNIPTVGETRDPQGPGDDLDADRALLGGRGGAGRAGPGRFVPMLCQHCGNAPCEPVCPVYAAYHTAGRPERPGLQPLRRHALLRQQLPVQGALLQLVQVQRDGVAGAAATAAQPRRHGAGPRRDGEVHLLRAADPRRARTSARLEDRPIRDGEFTTACAQACPSDAIVFGDVTDPESRVAATASRTPAATTCSRSSTPGRRSPT